MPSSLNILEGLTAIANEWQGLAMAWHALVAASLIGLLSGWRPSRRLVGLTIALSLASVSILAWTASNPFNGVVFGVLALTLGGIAFRFPGQRVVFGSVGMVISGTALVAFGWVYPHFLETRSWMPYLYASPLGLIPCPTLATSIGITLAVGMFGAGTWSTVLALAGMLYGFIGVFRLGVLMDLVLLGGAIGLAVLVGRGSVASARSGRLS
jgi:hypothetical protein